MFRALTVDGVPKLYLNECANDLWVRESVFPERRNGFFVEAGAADGFCGSSCFLLEKHFGWRGICIEPNDAAFAQLRTTRPGSVHENVCLAERSGEVEFVEAGGGDHPMLSGVRPVMELSKSRGTTVVANGRVVRKRAVALAELLRKHHAPKVIDYGAFDIEGSEWEVFRSFPFDEYGFRALSLELDGAIARDVTGLLEANGYREVKNPFNAEFPWERYFLLKPLYFSA